MKLKIALTLLVLLGALPSASAQGYGDRGYGPRDGEIVLTSMRSNEYSRYITDREGRSLYVLLADRRGASRCYGTCARAWPPLTTDDEESVRVRRGLNPRLVDTVRRRDGRMQVTYGGWPLYYYARDRRPDQTLGHGVHDRWGEWRLFGSDGRPKPDPDDYGDRNDDRRDDSDRDRGRSRDDDRPGGTY